MMTQPKYKNSAAFYDVDGTLIKINIVHAFAFYAARHASLAESAARTVKTAFSIPVFWAADKLSRKWFNEIFYRSYEGASEDRLVVLAEPAMRPGDCRIEWADGGICRDSAAVTAAIDQAVSRYISACREAAPKSDIPWRNER